MRGNWLLRPILRRRWICSSSSSRFGVTETLNSVSVYSSIPKIQLSNHSNDKFLFSTNPHFLQYPRTFTSQGVSDSKSNLPNIVPVNSEEDYNTAFSKAQDESLPSIFYFTAEWCGPCRYLSPVVAQLMERYPHVTTYKIDIDKESLQKKLSELSITSVPTLHFFQNGKKAAQIVGADFQGVQRTVEELYK